MSLRNAMTSGLILAAILSTGGCALQYNGAFGLKSKDRKTIEAYRKLKQKQATALTAEASLEAGGDAVAFDSEPADASVPPTAEPIAAAPEADITILDGTDAMMVAASGEPIHAMRLYGTLPQATIGRQSPLDGTENIRQISFAAQGSDFDPDIDYTGRKVVYSSTQHRENADIYLKRSDGTAVTQLTNDPARDEMPAFSPNGGQVAFASNRTGNWDIFLIDVAGGQPVQVTNDPSDEIHPSFSPDGTQIVYCSFGERSGQWELVIIDVANPARKKFLGFGLFPHWSPNGSKIVYQRAREWGTRWFSIWTLDLVEGEALRFTEVVACTNAAAITPTWSTDGEHIVFCTVVNPGDADKEQDPVQADVWLVRSDGTGRANLTNSPYANLQPAWGGDGSIVFVSNRARDGRESIWSLRPDRAMRVAHATRSRSVRSASGIGTAPSTHAAPGHGTGTSSDVRTDAAALAVTPVEP